MLLIVAHRWDTSARRLAQRWTDAGHRAGLLTSADLLTPHWQFVTGQALTSTACIAGERVAGEEISGVLMRLASISARELPELAEQDRAYAADEMTAFLRSWLTELSCPLLNRPTAVSLAGPAWRHERWLAAAARIGIPVVPLYKQAVALGTRTSEPATDLEPGAQPAEGTAQITVIGEQCLSDGDPSLQSQARLLARVAGVELVTLHFSGAERGAAFVAADTWPDISANPRLEPAVLAYFRRLGRQRGEQA
ncbi:hypothetical protein KSC_072870 [Ktedonobacter sp. SOSP1-52]|uniref:hypothetical protein n=1 Tax=Ktedonobacter sp. SOSP1-52 TaxID=2778366 RepID=UPI001914E670|nr:hypothetical protein [Ktedonobacter sp. SOSP1-52]GHO68395.1 hypothetical protein KSC_072870 [Ktedonobacter sp. SOSP1-52]